MPPSYKTRITAKLTAALAPEMLEITDDSARHAGHSGAQPGGETHFTVRIVSRHFAGLPRVARHRQVYTILADELGERVHALALTTLTPDEVVQKT
jgi:BolA protein